MGDCLPRRAVGCAPAGAAPPPWMRPPRNCPNRIVTTRRLVTAFLLFREKPLVLSVSPLPLHHHRAKPPPMNSRRWRGASCHNPYVPNAGLPQKRFCGSLDQTLPKNCFSVARSPPGYRLAIRSSPPCWHAQRERGMPSALLARAGSGLFATG